MLRVREAHEISDDRKIENKIMEKYHIQTLTKRKLV